MVNEQTQEWDVHEAVERLVSQSDELKELEQDGY
jgi:hypothetical protein